MQLLLIRHALPVSDGGADPELSVLGRRMASRLPQAVRRFGVTRVVSSPQLRARQTATPLCKELGLVGEVDDQLAEYDYGVGDYVPVEQMRAQNPEKLARLVAGELPDGIDVEAFKARVCSAAKKLMTAGSGDKAVAVVAHGGVINVLLQKALDTPRLFPFPIDYASVTDIRCSPKRRPIVLGVNTIEHVWDLLPRLTKT